jgi:hypothetical protein
MSVMDNDTLALQREEIARDERGALDETPWSARSFVRENMKKK